MKRQQIKLAQGEEIIVNGFVIRAIGPLGKPDSLSIYHPAVMVDHDGDVEKEKVQRTKHLYAGIANDILVKSTVCIGLVGRLAQSTGWNGAVKTAKDYLA